MIQKSIKKFNVFILRKEGHNHIISDIIRNDLISWMMELSTI